MLRNCISLQRDGANHSPRSDIMTYLVRSLYQHSFATSEEQAHTLAYQYLCDMMRNKLPESRLWVKVINVETDAVQVVTPVSPTSRVYYDEFTGLQVQFFHTQIMTI